MTVQTNDGEEYKVYGCTNDSFLIWNYKGWAKGWSWQEIDKFTPVNEDGKETR